MQPQPQFATSSFDYFFVPSFSSGEDKKTGKEKESKQNIVN